MEKSDILRKFVGAALAGLIGFIGAHTALAPVLHIL